MHRLGDQALHRIDIRRQRKRLVRQPIEQSIKNDRNERHAERAMDVKQRVLRPAFEIRHCDADRNDR
jgi:hypothetical protein